MGTSWAWKTVRKWRATPKTCFKAWISSRERFQVQDKVGHICMLVGSCQWNIEIEERGKNSNN